MLIAKDRPHESNGRTAVCYRDGRIDEHVAFEHLGERAASPESVVWLDVNAPCDQDLADLQEEFGLHPLAIEDIRRPQQRPKVDSYENTLLVVLFDVGQDANGHLRLNEVAFFIGDGYIISVHARPVPALDAVRERWQQNPRMVEPSPIGFLLYRIASALVDGFFPVIDQCDARVERIEDRIFEGFEARHLQALLRLRRELTELRRAIGPQRDVFTTLARHDDDVLDAKTDPYFADIVDLVLRLTDTIDTIRDRLSAALDAQLTLQSTELNQTMKRLTALTVVIMVPTLIAGVYGMNFDQMPELHWAFGYPMALGMMFLAMAVAALIFKRNDWF